MTKNLFLLVCSSFIITYAMAQQKPKPEDTEVYSPVPAKVTPGKIEYKEPPSDAVILFDGKNLDEWVTTNDRNQPANWKVEHGLITVNKSAGNIETKRAFGSYQLH